jgi:antitoxin Phd
MKPLRTAFGTKVWEKRVGRGKVMADQAKALGLSVSYISAIELGKRRIPDDYPTQVSNWLELSEEETAELCRLASIRSAAMREIQLRDAKASLSAVVDEAMQGKPAIITRHGKRQAVVVSYDEWERLSHVPTFGRLLMAAPLATDDLPGRNNSVLRTTDL